ncbi:MAG TPA: TonB-dependent receptor [Ferruginibacter sp.]|nr:TonB-dependent receptor [Ferruginibacter sp.]
MAQGVKNEGVIAGNIIDDQTSRQVSLATILVKNLLDTSKIIETILSDKDGEFIFTNLPVGIYRISISAVGYAPLNIDSINIRKERMDFNIADIRISVKSKNLADVIVYAEKPLFENKDGKITFNAGESALSAGSSTTELLKQTPLVSVDSDGKILMKGKEVKILIDDKPVEMDARQLQDLLESMPGSMIEKIEVLTTPPPQYANERGGVINIVTKKGKVGMSGRLNLNYGSRGEAGINANFSYRKNKLALNFSSGFSYNRYRGNSYSNRENIYADSANYFNTIGSSTNKNTRPTSRLNLDYEFNKQNALSFTAFFNANNNDGESITQYSNINRYKTLYKLSSRNVGSENSNINPSANISYTHKWKNPGEVLRITGGAAYSKSIVNRNFYQQYLLADGSFNGSDSTQQQDTRINNHTLSLRINYDKPLKDKKTQLNFGGTANYTNTHNQLLTSYLKKPDNVMVGSDKLSNDFEFYQVIYTMKTAIRYQFTDNLFSNIGVQQEYANTSFDIVNNTNHFKNSYFSTLPFANLTLKWDSGYSVTASYKRSIQRPGIHQLNPSIDYSDPYNTRFGNPYLQPYFSDNFDLGTGYWNKKYNINFSLGYNALQEIYSSIRTLQADGKTNTSWQNLSGRKEYETSIWGGITMGKKIKVNASSRYAYNVYSLHDRKVNRYQNGASFNSTLNGNYQWNTLMNLTGNFTYHRFATPQDRARNNLSMNIGVQRKFFQKNLSVSINVVDPFRQQQNKNFIQAPNYNLESFSTSNSRNIRIAAGYTFKKKVKKKK